MARKSRLGLLGPAVVLAGLIIGGVGVWIIYKNKPSAGAVIDTFVVDDKTKIVLRTEDGGPRSFVELVENGALKWQAMIPPYAGKPGQSGVAWSQFAISVRVVRDGKAEIFALARANGSKLGGTHLAAEKSKIKLDAPGPITLTDHLRSYELVAGDGWNQLIAMDLKLGTALWKRELGAAPITGGRVEGGEVVLDQAGVQRWFNVFTGKENRSTDKVGKPWEERPQVAPEWPATTGAGSANPQ